MHIIPVALKQPAWKRKKRNGKVVHESDTRKCVREAGRSA